MQKVSMIQSLWKIRASCHKGFLTLEQFTKSVSPMTSSPRILADLSPLSKNHIKQDVCSQAPISNLEAKNIGLARQASFTQLIVEQKVPTKQVHVFTYPNFVPKPF